MTPAADIEDSTLPREASELEALLEVSQTLVSSFDIDRNLRHAMRILHERLGLTRGTIALVDPETREIRIAAAYGLTRAQLTRGIYRPGEGVVGRVVASGRVMVVPDIGDEPLFLNRTASRPEKAEISFVSVPIMLRGELLGALSADRVFDESVSLDEDVRVLEIIASMIAHAVRLYWTYRHEVSERERMRGELHRRYSLPNIIGESDVMQEVFRVAGKVARSQATVFLRGESGTGKELIARGGTIFLDEVGDVPQPLQAKLLRVLQERTFERLGGTRTLTTDARIVSATNRDLEAMSKVGEFREDLYWRLNVVPLFLPALRERRDDLPLLIEHFLERFNATSGAEVRFTPDAMHRLMGYPWPGNIRELENTIQRLVVLADDDEINAADLPLHILMHDVPEEGSVTGLTLDEEVEVLERRRILAALRTNGHVQAKAARALGISARQLGYKMRKYDIEGG